MRGSLSPKLDGTLVVHAGQLTIDARRRPGEGEHMSGYLTRGDRLMASVYLLMALGCVVFLGFVGVMWFATS